jgi:hypothetical protein
MHNARAAIFNYLVIKEHYGSLLRKMPRLSYRIYRMNREPSQIFLAYLNFTKQNLNRRGKTWKGPLFIAH